MNRTRTLAIIVAIAILSAAIGWYVGQQVKNPNEVAAEAAPPPASAITAPVESRALSRDVVTRVNASYSDTSDIRLTANVGTNVLPVVTGRLPERDTLLSEGDVILEIAQRPFFILGGELPLFRSLRPGDEGIDVKQLEDALLSLGFFDDIPDTTFDIETERGIEAMYAAAGYSAPGPSDDEQARLDAAKTAVKNANDQVISAQESVDRALEGEPTSAMLSRENGWTEAQRSLTAAEEAAKEPLDTNPQVVGAREARDAASAALTAAQTAYNNAVSGVTTSPTAVPTVAAAGNGGSLQTSFDPATGQPLAGDGFTDPTATDPTATGATAPAPTAVAPEPIDVTELWNALTEAQTNLAKAETNLSTTINSVSTESQLSLTRARERFAIDEAAYREAVDAAQPDASDAQKALDAQREQLLESQEQLAELESSTGTWLPDYEFMFLSNLPRRINRVLVDRGGLVGSGAVIQATGAELRVVGGIPEVNRPLVTLGDRVVVDEPDLGLRFEGTISELADAAGTSTDYPSRYFFRIELEGDVDVDQLVDVGNFRITIPIERTEGEVLAVPLAALSAGADGSARVEVLRGDETKLITVSVGLESGGFAEVKALEDSLEIGDQVVVGFENSFANNDDDASEDEDGG